jgi:hypothetical protein
VQASCNAGWALTDTYKQQEARPNLPTAQSLLQATAGAQLQAGCVCQLRCVTKPNNDQPLALQTSKHICNNTRPQWPLQWPRQLCSPAETSRAVQSFRPGSASCSPHKVLTPTGCWQHPVHFATHTKPDTSTGTAVHSKGREASAVPQRRGDTTEAHHQSRQTTWQHQADKHAAEISRPWDLSAVGSCARWWVEFVHTPTVLELVTETCSYFDNQARRCTPITAQLQPPLDAMAWPSQAK